MGDVERRDEDTAVVMPSANERKSGRDYDPARQRKLSRQEPIPDDEWIHGEVSEEGEGHVDEAGFVLKTSDPSPDELTSEWIWASEAINARDER